MIEGENSNRCDKATNEGQTGFHRRWGEPVGQFQIQTATKLLL